MNAKQKKRFLQMHIFNTNLILAPLSLNNKRRPTDPTFPRSQYLTECCPWVNMAWTSRIILILGTLKCTQHESLQQTHSILPSSSSPPTAGRKFPLPPLVKVLGDASDENRFWEEKLKSEALASSLLPPSPLAQSLPPREKDEGWMKPPFCWEGFTHTLFPNP